MPPHSDRSPSGLNGDGDMIYDLSDNPPESTWTLGVGDFNENGRANADPAKERQGLERGNILNSLIYQDILKCGNTEQK